MASAGVVRGNGEKRETSQDTVPVILDISFPRGGAHEWADIEDVVKRLGSGRRVGATLLYCGHVDIWTSASAPPRSRPGWKIVHYHEEEGAAGEEVVVVFSRRRGGETIHCWLNMHHRWPGWKSWADKTWSSLDFAADETPWLHGNLEYVDRVRRTQLWQA